KVQIGPGGDITIDDAYFATIKLADLNDKENLEKVGSTFFKLKDSSKTPQDVTVPQVIVGAVEKSNVNLMDGMSSMIITSRTFELQKTTADVMFKLLRKTITDIAKPI
ncbi:MAG: hypothetical protein GY757_11510, partial [bacterium]|nr:hypothetical protein [bacterium]